MRWQPSPCRAAERSGAVRAPARRSPRPAGRRPVRSALLAFLAALAAPVVLVALAGPAAADPARPTDDRSEVLAVVPPVPGLAVAVAGGDAFLSLSAPPGRTVSVPGYEGEPYLRIGPDGSVERNERSPAAWLNRDRLGGDLPPEASATAEPEWRRIGGGGQVAWHDHRIHTMAGPRRAATWEVPLTVDGERVVVQGRLTPLKRPVAWPWWLLAAGVATGTALGARRPRVLGVAVSAAAAAALAVELARRAALPGEADPGAAVLVLPAVALAVGVAALVLGRPRRAAWWPPALAAGGGAALAVWSLTDRDVLARAVLLSDLPAWVERLVTAGALGVGAGAVVGGAWAVWHATGAARPLTPSR